MKITIDGVPYDTQHSEPICERFNERADNFEIEQVQETLYRTKGGNYFLYAWRFYDAEENMNLKEDRIEESVRTMTSEETIHWLRTVGLTRGSHTTSTVFFPIGNKPKFENAFEALSL